MNIHFSPLRYPGGKNCIFPFIARMFYENNLIGANYAEPYAGGAGLALRLLYEGFVNHIYINDLDKSIYAFWINILNNTDNFCKWIDEVEVSIHNWQKYKEVQNNLDSFDSFNLAKATFFLNRTNISGVIKGGVIGGVNQNGKYSINARFNKKDLIDRIKRISALKHRISVSNYDGLIFLNKIGRKKEDVLIYLDPPYYKKGADLYMNYYTQNDHKKLATYVKNIDKNWIVSYDNHEFILQLFSTHRKVLYKLSQAASNRVGDEILIFSDNIAFKESIENLRSAVVL